MDKKLPSFWQVLIIELVTLVIDILALVITVFFIIGGIVRFLTFFIDTKSVFKPWAMIKELWEPIKWHYIFLGWILKSTAEKLKTEVPKYRHTTSRGYSFESNCYSPEEVLEAIFIGVQFAYLGVLFVYIIVLLTIPAAVLVAIKLNSNAKQVVTKPITPPTYQASEIQKQEQDFGPFINQKEVDKLRSKSGVNNFALIEDTGEVRYSQKWTVDPADKAWIPSAAPRITAQEIKGTAVIFKDDRDNTFHLNIDQPFSFENAAMVVYIFHAGKLMQAMRDNVAKKDLSEIQSNVKSNPELSIL